MADNAPMIVFEHVEKSYSPGVDALNDVNLVVNKGEFLFIVGSSGSGKSTLIRLLLKEIEPTSGKIFVNGTDITAVKHRKVPMLRRRIGIVFQEFRLLNDRDVFENVALAQRLARASHKDLKKNVMGMLGLMGLADKKNALPKELSGGEQQRVALARAMVNRPEILLADEPTGNLDPKNAWNIMGIFNEIHRMGTTILMVTHNTEIVDSMQKRVVTLQNGVMVGDEQKAGYEQKADFEKKVGYGEA